MTQIYGMDLSQKKIDVNFISSKQKSVHRIIKNNLSGIANFLDSLPKNALLCAEYTGVYGDLLVFMCNCLGVSISLSTGYQIRHSLGLQKGKSDKIDALRIREYGERFEDKLVLTEYPSEKLKELKQLFRLRSQLVKERKMLQTHEKSTLSMPYCSVKAHVVTQSMLQHLTVSINQLEADIWAIIDSDVDLRRNNNLITDIIGIGQVTACDLIT